jgi:hypothetical protein
LAAVQELKAPSEQCAIDKGKIQGTEPPTNCSTLTEDNSLAAELPEVQPEASLEKPAHDQGKARRAQPTADPGKLSLFQANLLVAMLAGYWARKSDGHPGPKVLAQGLIILAVIVDYARLNRPSKPPPPPKRPRKPG